MLIVGITGRVVCHCTLNVGILSRLGIGADCIGIGESWNVACAAPRRTC
jgi:hypothetical protein